MLRRIHGKKSVIKPSKKPQMFRTQKILENPNKIAQLDNYVEKFEEVGGHRYPLGS